MYISTYFYIFTPICIYFYIYLPIFTTKVWYFTTVYHISVVFYHSLPVFIYIYHKSVVFYYSLTQKCGIYELENVPGNLVHFIYVPDVPVIWYKSGTKTSSPQDENKFPDFGLI